MARTITIVNNLSSNDPLTVGDGFTPQNAYLSHAVAKMLDQQWQVPGQQDPTSVYYHQDYGQSQEAYTPGTDCYPPVAETSVDPSTWQKGSNWKTWTIQPEGWEWSVKGNFEGLPQNTWYLTLAVSCTDYSPNPVEFVVVQADSFQHYLILNLIYIPDPTRNCVYYGYVLNLDGTSTTYQLGANPAFTDAS